jgi:hypothetical protein
MEERSTPLVGVRPQIFFLFLFVSERYFHLYTTYNTRCGLRCEIPLLTSMNITPRRFTR